MSCWLEWLGLNKVESCIRSSHLFPENPVSRTPQRFEKAFHLLLGRERPRDVAKTSTIFSRTTRGKESRAEQSKGMNL